MTTTTEKTKRRTRSEETGIPLSIVINCRTTYASTFKPSVTLANICREALHSNWRKKEEMPLGGWKLTDKYGRKLNFYAKLGEAKLPPQDMVYLSRKDYAGLDENVLVRAEDKIEQRL